MTTRDLGFVALFAALIVALGIVPAIPLAGGVPITLQSLGVMLAGLILGPKRGALAAVVVMALVALGLPVLAGGRGGIGVFAGPTTGYLVGWAIGAFVTGTLAMRLDVEGRAKTARIAGLAGAAALGGLAVVHGLGILWLAFYTGLGLAKAFMISIAFVPGDLLKAVVAAFVAFEVRRAYPLERK